MFKFKLNGATANRLWQKIINQWDSDYLIWLLADFRKHVAYYELGFDKDKCLGNLPLKLTHFPLKLRLKEWKSKVN